MEINKQIHRYVQDHKAEIVDILKELIKIPSVRGKAECSAPFGRECRRVLEFTKKLYDDNGFNTELDIECGYLLSYYGEGKKALGLFSHADVVPAGNDWRLGSPFEPVEKDGFLVGRGALDDKSAVVTSLFCAKMLKELNIPFNSRLVCFTGACEETGMDDIKNYIAKHRPPDFSLVCDTAFPLYRGNKGILHFTATQQKPMQSVTEFCGGTAFNIVLGEATAKIGTHIFTEKGISSHGALPENSLNAAYILSKKLLEDASLAEYDREQSAFIATVLENYYGEAFGIEHTDSDFGKLTVTNGIVKMNECRISLCFDMRYGASLDIEKAKEKINRFFAQNGWDVNYIRDSKPFVISEDDFYVTACMNAYKSFTGNENAKSAVNAGGTYARYLPRAAEIGTTLQWGVPHDTPRGHGGVHAPDECISIEGLLNAIELTMLMLIECDKDKGV